MIVAAVALLILAIVLPASILNVVPWLRTGWTILIVAVLAVLGGALILPWRNRL